MSSPKASASPQPQQNRAEQPATVGERPPPKSAGALAAFNKFSMNKSSSSKVNSSPYTSAAQAALLAHSKQDRDRPIINNPANAPNAVPTRTAVLFLGKDWERWHRYDRDSSLQLGWQPRGVASAVTDCRVSPHTSSSSSSGESSDDEYAKHAAVFSSDDDDEHNESDIAARLARSDLLGTSSGSNNDSDVFSLQRRMTRRARLLSSTSTSTILESTSSRPHSPAPFSPSPHIRERRYSSNGPEAAFLRHETVIGIHTPRSANSNSPASSSGCRTPSERRFPLAPLSQILPSAPSSSADAHQQHRQASLPASAPPSASTRRTSAPAPQEPAPTEQHPSRDQHLHQQAPSGKEKHAPHAPNASTHRTASAQTVNPNATPAARKMSLAEVPLRKKSQVSKSHKETGPATSAQIAAERASKSSFKRGHSAEKRASDHAYFLQARRSSRSSSLPASQHRKRRPRRLQLEPAVRRPSVAVQGTLYDEEGPFVEGAVQDGLSVRIFNGPDVECCDQKREYAGQSETELSPLGLSIRTGEDAEQSHWHAYADDRGSGGGGIITYLITTPDNRVSSAAKLRRWAMDSRGNFYAAMEIKSVEAKLRAGGALPNYPYPGTGTASGASSSSSSSAATVAAEEEAAEAYYYSRQLIRSMQETYVEDIVSEIQKAQTLNPGRSTVSRLLKTEDDKYVRLEEDYPEEAFFVLVGCEEYELYPVVVLVFVEALRALARFHDAGWLHGDVKLENLMFDVKGNLVVIDYENANMFRKPASNSSAAATSTRRRKRPNTGTGAGQLRSSSASGTGNSRRPTSSRGRKNSSRPSSRRGNGTAASELTVPGSSGGTRSSSGSPSTSPGQRAALDESAGAPAGTASFPPPEARSNGVVAWNSSTSRSSSSNNNGGVASKTMARDASHTSSQVAYADDEAEFSDGEQHADDDDEEEDEEHLVRLISYDWTPPEASSSYAALHGSGGNSAGNGNGHQGNGGRMMGPSGDLWALGCNLIRAFALRDGVPDVEVREVLLGSGQRAFFKHRAQVLANWQKAKAEEAATAQNNSGPEDTSLAKSTSNPYKLTPLEPPSSPAARVLHRFSQEAPKLMHYVLARCVTPHSSERGWEAEQEGLKLAEELERERLQEPIPPDGAQRTFGSGNTGTGPDPAQAPLRKVDAEEEEHGHGVPPLSSMHVDPRMAGLVGPEPPLLMDVARAAILKAIDISGSMWVRPKLEEARRSLGFELGADERPGYEEGDPYYGYEAVVGGEYEYEHGVGPQRSHYY
ncbi:hypothetical protein OC861_001913 [Tilletia horrida]|nr:hypothetical protein OC861_001913 [Tilletia horrida]